MGTRTSTPQAAGYKTPGDLTGHSSVVFSYHVRHTDSFLAGIHPADNVAATFYVFFKHGFRLQTCRNDGACPQM